MYKNVRGSRLPAKIGDGLYGLFGTGFEAATCVTHGTSCCGYIVNHLVHNQRKSNDQAPGHIRKDTVLFEDKLLHRYRQYSREGWRKDDFLSMMLGIWISAIILKVSE